VLSIDPRHLLTGDRSNFFCLGIGECMIEAVAARIGMAVDNVSRRGMAG
jgi:hypothetical protein